MRSLFLMGLVLIGAISSAQPAHDIHCSNGDDATEISFSDGQAFLRTMHSDLETGTYTISRFSYSPENSDATYFRYVDATGTTALEVSKDANRFGETQVKLNGQHIKNCYLNP